MLQVATDRLTRPFGEVYDDWMRRYAAEGPVLVNFRSLVGSNSGVDRYTHLLHPYPAKLLLNIPLFFLNCEQLGTGGRLLDPFCGTGTVLLEGLIAGREIIGCDSNPLARLITSAKTTFVPRSEVEHALDELKKAIPTRGRAAPTGTVRLERWFTPKACMALSRLTRGIGRLAPSTATTFLTACASATIGRLSLTDPRISVPVQLDPSRPGLTDAQRADRVAWLASRQRADAFAVFERTVFDNLARMDRLRTQLGPWPAPRILADARAASSEGLVDLVITSPPYASAQKYIRASSLSLQWLGLAPNGLRHLERRNIGCEHWGKDDLSGPLEDIVPSAREVLAKVGEINPLRRHIAAQFLRDMADSIREIARTVRHGGYMVLVIGNNVVAGHPFDSRTYLSDIAAGCGFRLELELIDPIRSRGLMTKRAGTAGPIAHEWILVFRRVASEPSDV